MSYKLIYRLEGDYYLPNLSLPESPSIGKYGEARFHRLKRNNKLLYDTLFMTDNLNDHLEEIDCSANEMYNFLMKQYKQQFDITEKLKEENQMEWVRLMNTAHKMAEEIIYTELINR